MVLFIYPMILPAAKNQLLTHAQLYQLCSMDCQCWSDCPIGFAVPG
jgi:hypothetical protein